MTSKQKYLIGAAVISLILGGIWYGIASMMGEGEPEKEAPPPALDHPQPSSSEDNSPEPNASSEDPAEVDPKEALKTAKKFLQAYLSFNGKNPTEHIEKAKPYMTERLYQEMIQHPPRPTAEMTRQKFVEFTEEYGDEDQKGLREVEWAIQAVTKVTNAEGKGREEEWTYIVVVVAEEGEPKVKEVEVRGIFD